MNERIKELLEQAGSDSSGKWLSHDNAVRLAHLVIRECAKIAEMKEQGYRDYEPDISVGWYMKKHFGVEV